MKFNKIIIHDSLDSLHYNGWNFIMNLIKKDIIDENSDVVLDSFADSCFWHKGKLDISSSKWVAFIHAVVKPNIFNEQTLNNFLKQPWFLNNKNNCIKFITLSKYTADALRSLTDIPVFHVYHPKVCSKFFDIKKYFQKPTLNHSGFHDRNLNKFAIFYTKIKKKLYVSKKWHLDYINNYLNNQTHTIEIKECYLNSDEYISNLVSCVGFAYYNDTSASNGLLEHIVSHTPIVVNKIPAVVEYIGEEYPLFYENIKHNPDLYLLDKEYIKQCSLYLKERSKLKIFSIEKFKKDILDL